MARTDRDALRRQATVYKPSRHDHRALHLPAPGMTAQIDELQQERA